MTTFPEFEGRVLATAVLATIATASIASLRMPPISSAIQPPAMQDVLAMTTMTATRAEPSGVVRVVSDTLRFDLDTGRVFGSSGDLRRDDASWLAPTSTVVLRAARDEVVAFQIAIADAPGIHRVRTSFHVSQRRASPVIAAIHAEVGIRVEDPSNSSRIHSEGPGLYPDVLVPTSTIVVPPAPGIAVVWVDLFVPRSTEPGVHRGTIEIGTLAKISVSLLVLEIELPREDVARLGAMNFGSFLELEKRDPSHLLVWMQLAHAHLLSVEFLRARPEIRDDLVDWEGYAARIGPFIDGSAFTAERGYTGPREGQPTTRFVLPHTDWWPVAARDRLPSDPGRFSRVLAEWESFAKSKGWFDRPNATKWILFVNSLDEPHDTRTLETIALYEQFLADARLEDRARVTFRVDGNFGQKIAGYSDERQAALLGGVVDQWNAHGASYTLPWKLLSERMTAHGEEVMYYVSNTSGEPAVPPLVLDSAIAGARATAWIVARYGIDGMVNWETFLSGDCATNPRCSRSELNQDALLIYPGEAFGRPRGEPLASMRLAILRRGAEDVALLRLLESIAPDDARQLAETMIPHALGDGTSERGLGAWPRDFATYDRARDAILDRLAHSHAPLPLGEVRPTANAHDATTWVVVALAMLAVGCVVVVRLVRRSRGVDLTARSSGPSHRPT